MLSEFWGEPYDASRSLDKKSLAGGGRNLSWAATEATPTRFRRRSAASPAVMCLAPALRFLLHLHSKANHPAVVARCFALAGAVGIEPTLLVLETRVLPLNDAPTELAYGKLLIANSVLFKRLFKRSNPFNQNFGLTIHFIQY